MNELSYPQLELSTHLSTLQIPTKHQYNLSIKKNHHSKVIIFFCHFRYSHTELCRRELAFICRGVSSKVIKNWFKSYLLGKMRKTHKDSCGLKIYFSLYMDVAWNNKVFKWGHLGVWRKWRVWETLV